MSSEPTPGPEPVTVFETQQESEAWVVHGLLTSAGIDAVVTSLEAPQDVLPGVGGIAVKVEPDRADEARQMIEDYRNDSTSEEPDTDDLPAV